jgi:hypothetical protein
MPSHSALKAFATHWRGACYGHILLDTPPGAATQQEEGPTPVCAWQQTLVCGRASRRAHIVSGSVAWAASSTTISPKWPGSRYAPCLCGAHERHSSTRMMPYILRLLVYNSRWKQITHERATKSRKLLTNINQSPHRLEGLASKCARPRRSGF